MRPLLIAAALTAACAPAAQESGRTMQDYDGPGSEAWGSDDVTCDSTSDCLSGELCEEGVCQVARCQAGPYESEAPIGQTFPFFQEVEVAVLDGVAYQGSYYVDGYDGRNQLSYDASFSAGSGSPDDLSGGRFTGKRAEQYVVADASKQRLGLLSGGDAEWFDAGLAPIAVAAGDIDGDGFDDAVAVSANGKMAVCELQRGNCETYGFDSAAELVDVAVADIDGDGLEEPVLLLDYDGERYLYGANLDAELTGQTESWSVYVGDGITRLAAADLDGDYIAEIITLGDGGWWGWSGDSVAAWNVIDASDGGSMVEFTSVELDFGDGLDVAAGDTDADDQADILVLDGERTVHAFKLQGSTLSNRYSTELDTSADPVAIAVADHDGNAPIARLIEDTPTAVSGAVVPLVLMIPPPYDHTYSDGPSSVGYGESNSTSESHSDTVSLGTSVDLGVGGGMDGLFKAEAGVKLSTSVTQKHSIGTSSSWGARYSMEANPELYGPHHGGVVLSWGCFDAYRYEVDDPSGLLDGQYDGGEFVLTVPVDGGTTLWSTNRYNAMAQATGSLPTIDIPYAAGDLDTYPSQPETITGKDVDPDDLLFPELDTYRVSDAGTISWVHSVGETESNSSSWSTSVGASAKVSVGGIKVGTGVSYGWGEGYSLSVGKTARFSGRLPALPDHPDTPEDEYAEHSYSVEPLIYRQHWEDDEGNPGAFWVLGAMVEG